MKRTTVAAICGISVLVFLLAAGIYGTSVLVEQGRFDSLRENRRNFMYEAIGALQSYSDVNARMPPAVVVSNQGLPLRSWRTEILPYISRPTTLPDGQAAWNDRTNAPITQVPLQPYCFSVEPKRNSIVSNILGVTGPGTAFDPERRHRQEELPGDTIVLIEVGQSNIPWAAPGDLDVGNIPPHLQLGTDGRGVHIAFADWTVWYLRRDVPMEKLQLFFRIESARRHDRNAELGEYLLHPR
jgi:hypothetical protein